MQLRIARHTNQLATITRFYCDVLGLEILGKFESHDGYDGVFIGEADAEWHLEFTANNETPNHKSYEDDLLVFYPETFSEYTELLERLTQANTKRVEAKNPYWNDNGATFLDPDGFRVVISPKMCK